MAKSRTTSGQLEICLPLGEADLWSEVSPSRGIYWPRAVLQQVTLTFDQSLGQTDLWSDVLPVEASSSQWWSSIRSASHLVSLWVMLTFGMMSPQ